MKTLYLTLSLLLLAVCCCNAMTPALYSVAPGSCCFKFSTKRVPVKSVADIKKTHHSCVKKGFIVTTVKGIQICYRETFKQALDVYNKFHNIEGSGQAH
uniref:C-C motif chemokine 3-like n=1 Tax=Monopterus albus TaxID=43700 RepID=UPI0009B48ED3|nr:C-C motif chemokine 3-like [Monopterus albus]